MCMISSSSMSKKFIGTPLNKYWYLWIMTVPQFCPNYVESSTNFNFSCYRNGTRWCAYDSRWCSGRRNCGRHCAPGRCRLAAGKCYIQEKKEVGEFLMNVEKDPAQDDFLQGRVMGNPNKSSDVGMDPLMRDKVCRFILLLEDEVDFLIVFFLIFSSFHSFFLPFSLPFSLPFFLSFSLSSFFSPYHT